MKRFLLLIICCAAIPLCAIAHAREPYKPKSEITARWGLDQGIYDVFYADEYIYWWGTPLERYNKGKYYRGDKIYTQALSLSYAREMKRWFAMSVSASFSGESQDIKERETGDAIYKYRCFRASVVPMARFTYLNRPMVRLYSAVGLGIGMKWTKDFYEKGHDYESYLTGQITAFGVSVGKRWFCSWEAGIGPLGYLVVGTGYRF